MLRPPLREFKRAATAIMFRIWFCPTRKSDGADFSLTLART
jgi:hypothetical protein